MKLPKTAIGLVNMMFRQIFPIVDEWLCYWKGKATKIPDKELRRQALSSIDTKKFHCQGGTVFALLAGDKWKEAVRFIVAYQTISDYLDNLCDRSTSLDPKDFQMLHESMSDALQPGNPIQNYYAHRKEKDDGGYLKELVLTCQSVLRNTDANLILQECLKLESLYAELQIHKHVRKEERIPRLTNWYSENNEIARGLRWNEFAAATGSTLGIFCLLAYTLRGRIDEDLAGRIVTSYFPSIQALHILLDYYIDQEEDELEGDLNFCTYYEDEVELFERMQYFLLEAENAVRGLPDSTFHYFIPKGLVALYLSDKKVKGLKHGKNIRRGLLRTAGYQSVILHYPIRLYYKMEL
jgi:tetraprenyl-beta-curcumene synthase